ncbi:MAG: RAD55 family ATPase [Candidatus Heimdallarchaeaceae archaeon]
MKLLKTNIKILDKILNGGFPSGSLNFIIGSPGTGKTILVQHILFNTTKKALYLTTLSEPITKVIKYVQDFEFFNKDIFGERVFFYDIGFALRKSKNVEEVIEFIMKKIDEIQPEVLVIDSFKAIRDMIKTYVNFRKFAYELSVQLSVVGCTSFLVGEYTTEDLAKFPEFAISDGIINLSVNEVSGNITRQIQAIKLRGQDVKLAPYVFKISSKGIRILCPSFEIEEKEDVKVEKERTKTGIQGLDDLLYGGIPRGRSILISRVSGTGKTILALQFLCKGAEVGEKGLLILTEETPSRLQDLAKGFGFKLEEYEKLGLIKIVHFSQVEINVNENICNIIEMIDDFRPDRFVLDSYSVFIHRFTDPIKVREQTFEFSTILKKYGITGFFISDIASGENRISRFGTEETVMDGVIILYTELKDSHRERFIEIYKMRSIKHVEGKYNFDITEKGIEVFYFPPKKDPVPPKPFVFHALKGLIQDINYGTTWLVHGSQGIGKSSLAYQFVIEGLKMKDSVLFIGLETDEYTIKKDIEKLQINLDPYIEQNCLRIIDLYQEDRIDITDLKRFIFKLNKFTEKMSKPCRIVIDSLNPIAINNSAKDFIEFIDYKNRIFRRSNVIIFETLLAKTLEENILYNTMQSYDVVIEMFEPNWGEMGESGQPLRAIRVKKARGAYVNTRIYPYIIKKGEGIVIQKDIY